MENNKIGIILIIVGLLIFSTVIIIKSNEDKLLNKVIEETGSCYLPDGTCLHETRSTWPYTLGWIISGIFILTGIFYLTYDKIQKSIINEYVVSEEDLTKKQTSPHPNHINTHSSNLLQDDEKFNILLKGLNPDEKKILNAVKEQDGITQQTLRFRTDLHKSKLSILLDSMEKKGLIIKQAKGKTNQVFMKIKV